MVKTKIIDMEAHFLTKDFADYLVKLEIPGVGSGREVTPSKTINRKLLDLGKGRIREMDEAGINRQVLSLFVPEDAYRRVQMLEPVAARTWAQRTNDELSAAVNKYPDRFVGLATIPAQSPDEAAAEIERAITKLNLKGVNITSHARNEYLDNKKYWSIFQTAERLGVPVYLHPSYPSAVILNGFNGYGGLLASASFGFGVEVSLHVLRLIMSGLFDEYPELKIIIGHMGEGLPYWFSRIDFAWKRDLWNKPSIKKRPSEYLKKNFMITTSGMFFIPSLMCAYSVLGSDAIAFGFDYPMEDINEALQFMKDAPVNEHEKAKIYYSNAEKIFGL
jgi:5-carboxyvanillate decarboxylase